MERFVVLRLGSLGFGFGFVMNLFYDLGFFEF